MQIPLKFGFMAVLTCIACLVLSGCETAQIFRLAVAGGPVMGDYYVSQPFLEEINGVQKASPKPLAREIKIVSVFQTLRDGKKLEPVVYSDDPAYLKQRSVVIPAISLVQQTPSSQLNSTKFSMRAHEASLRGDHGDSIRYHNMAIASRKAEVAFEQAAAAVNVFGASLGMLSAALDAKSKAQEKLRAVLVKSYLANNLRVAGPSAPANSVLHVFLLQRIDVAFAPFRSINREQIILTLDDGQGHVYSSAADFNWFMSESKQTSGKWKAPELYAVYHAKDPLADGGRQQVANEITFRFTAVANALSLLVKQVQSPGGIRRGSAPRG